MTKANQQQDVSVLSSARNGLVYLTGNDWALIVDKAVRQQYKAGAQILHTGRPTAGLYLILKGTVLAQIPPHGPGRLIGPGEVCGEISFLDDLTATAIVIAKTDAEVYLLDRPTLQSLFELFPHLGSRFYRSLAAILARRLREVIGTAAVVKKESGTSAAK